MKKAISKTFLFFILSFSVYGQESEVRISWNSEVLTWDNFAGVPDPANSFHANTSSGISYSWSKKQSGDEIEFFYEVISYFTPDHSWVKPEKNTPGLLAHEQLHFDITELHARKLRKIMTEFDFRNTRSIKPALEAFYKAAQVSLLKMQKEYDAETRHSIDVEAQVKWQNYIKEELEKLKDFSS